MELRTIGSLAFIVGFALYCWASIRYRKASAPPLGSGGGRPYIGKSEWFTPGGYRLRVIGAVLWNVGALCLALGLLVH